MTPVEISVGKRHSAGVPRMVKKSLKIDMTPMVDLGFLLISFFIITTELSKPYTAPLHMPKDGIPSKIADPKALTVLVGKNDRLFYYHGDWEKARAAGAIFETTFSYEKGLGRVIRDKQSKLFLNEGDEGKKGLMLLIKASEHASYQNTIDIIDDILINGVSRYAIVKMTSEESKYLEAR